MCTGKYYIYEHWGIACVLSNTAFVDCLPVVSFPSCLIQVSLDTLNMNMDLLLSPFFILPPAKRNVLPYDTADDRESFIGSMWP